MSVPTMAVAFTHGANVSNGRQLSDVRRGDVGSSRRERWVAVA